MVFHGNRIMLSCETYQVFNRYSSWDYTSSSVLIAYSAQFHDYIMTQTFAVNGAVQQRFNVNGALVMTYMTVLTCYVPSLCGVKRVSILVWYALAM